MATEGICIFVVNPDPPCSKIAAEILNTCTYEVLHCGGPLETLGSICQRKEAITVVLTNLHRIEGQGTTDILDHIQKILKLPTLFMSPNDEKIELGAQNYGFIAYLLGPTLNNTIPNLWELASVNVSDVTKALELLGHPVPMASQPRNQENNQKENNASKSEQEERRRRRRRRRRERSRDGEGRVQKRHRVIWTEELHTKFLDALLSAYPGRAVPKKIVEQMNVPGLKRENVSSHLQKYRINVKKAEERAKADASNSGRDLENPEVRRQLGLPAYDSGWLDYHHKRRSSMLSYGGRRMANNFHLCLLGLHKSSSSNNSTGRSSSGISTILGTKSGFQAAAGNNQQGSMLPQQQNNNQLLARTNNNYLHFANSRSNDYPSSLQETLLNLSGSRVDAERRSHQGSCNFVGFRLSNDGKALEFGSKGASGGTVFKKDELLSSRTPGNQNNQTLDHLQNFSTSISTGNTGLQQSDSARNHNPGDINSSFFDYMSRLVLEDIMPTKTAAIHQHPSLPHDSSSTITTPQFEFLSIPAAASWGLSVESAAPFPASEEQQQQASFLPTSNPLENSGSVQYQTEITGPTASREDHTVAHSGMLSAPSTENPNPGPSASIQPRTASGHNVEQESSMPMVSEDPNSSWMDENLYSILNEAGCPSLWEGNSNDAFF